MTAGSDVRADVEARPQPPHDALNEQCVLGAMLLSRDAVKEAQELLAADDFYDHGNRTIYSTILGLHGRGEPVDHMIVLAELDRHGDLDRVGGAPYLFTLIQTVPTATNIASYAKAVAEKAELRGYDQGAQQLRQMIREGVSIDRVRAALPTTTAPRRGSQLSFLDGASFVLDIPDKIAAIWGQGDEVIHAPGEALTIVGPPGVGKTTVAGQYCGGRLGLFSSVLGYPIVPGERRVLYLAMDRPAQTARALNRQFRNADRDVLADRLVVWKGPPPKDMARHPEILAELCEQAGADTVIVDSLKDAAIGLSDDEIGAGYNRARQTALTAGVEVVELHHQRKSQNGAVPNRLDDVYGSVWITAGAGSVVLLWGDAGDPVVRWHHLKQPMTEVGPLQVEHDHERGITSLYHGSVDLVKLAARREGITARQAAEALADDPKKVSPAALEKARRRLDRLDAQGVLIKTDFGARGGVIYRTAAHLWEASNDPTN